MAPTTLHVGTTPWRRWRSATFRSTLAAISGTLAILLRDRRRLITTATDDAAIHERQPFLVKDVLFSAILVAANEALLKVAEIVSAQDGERELIAGWAGRGREGLDACWDPNLQSYLDHDARTGEPLCSRNVAGYAPLIWRDRARLPRFPLTTKQRSSVTPQISKSTEAVYPER